MDGLEGASKGHSVQPPAVSRDVFTQTRLPRTPCSEGREDSKPRHSAPILILSIIFPCRQPAGSSLVSEQ